MNLTIYINDTFEEEKALLDSNNKILLMGDYYHNKIDELIKGLILGLQYCGNEVKVDNIRITPEDLMFDIIGFYNESDD